MPARQKSKSQGPICEFLGDAGKKEWVFRKICGYFYLIWPVDLGITSLLPPGPTGSSCGYVDNIAVDHIPTAQQFSGIQKGNKLCEMILHIFQYDARIHFHS